MCLFLSSIIGWFFSIMKSFQFYEPGFDFWLHDHDFSKFGRWLISNVDLFIQRSESTFATTYSLSLSNLIIWSIRSTITKAPLAMILIISYCPIINFDYSYPITLNLTINSSDFSSLQPIIRPLYLRLSCQFLIISIKFFFTLIRCFLSKVQNVPFWVLGFLFPVEFDFKEELRNLWFIKVPNELIVDFLQLKWSLFVQVIVFFVKLSDRPWLLQQVVHSIKSNHSTQSQIEQNWASNCYFLKNVATSPYL